jgi:hypothetical protein
MSLNSRSPHNHPNLRTRVLGQRPAIVLFHLAAFVLIVVAAWLLAPAQAAATAPGAADENVSARSKVLARSVAGSSVTRVC